MEYRSSRRAGGWALLALGLTATALAIVMAGGGQRASAANITVTTNVDELNADGDCSLREAIRAANTNSPVDACGTGGLGLDTITVPASYYQLAIGGANENLSVTGDLDISCLTAPPACNPSGPIAIVGAGSSWTVIAGCCSDRVFDIQPSVGGVTISGMTIHSGSAPPAAGGSGGGVRVGNSAGVTLDNVYIHDNSATSSGGGVYNSGTLVINNSTIKQNTAANGGGILNFFVGASSSLTLVNSTVVGNYATGTGGAGLDNRGVANLTNVTITDNQALTGGSDGGGILHGNSTQATLSLTNVTVANNTSGAASGGGIHRVVNGGNPVLKNTIVADNAPQNCYGAVTSGGWNLDSGTSCGLGSPGDISNGFANLAWLADNGGPTWTREILPGTQAWNAGGNCPPPSTDQRGVARPQSAACDIGAYEAGAAPPPPPTPTPPPSTPTPVPTATPVPTPTAAPAAFGNVDCMNGINSVDALAVLRYNAGLAYIQSEPCPDIGSMTVWSELQGDVDCDSAVSSVDALKLQRHNAGLSVSQVEPCPDIGS